jgi:3-dehydroquinate synthase
MVAAGRASALVLGFPDEARQRDLIARLGLPVAAPEADPDRVRSLLAYDKKRDGAGLRMVLLEAFGTPRVEHVDSATVEAALAAIGISGGAK